MTPESARDFIHERGQPAKIVRLTKGPGGAQSEIIAEIPMFIREFDPAPLVGDMRVTDREVKMAALDLDAKQWPVPPQAGDRVVADGYTGTLTGPVKVARLPDGIAWYVARARG